MLESGVVDTEPFVTDGDEVAARASGRGPGVIEDGPALGAPLGGAAPTASANAGGVAGHGALAAAHAL